jgi:hypothetical protein
MANITIDNEVISYSLVNGDSVTVPTGEVWDVEISMNGKLAGLSDVTMAVEINGYQVRANLPFLFETVLVGGDTVDVINSDNNSSGGVTISGYRVA